MAWFIRLGLENESVEPKLRKEVCLSLSLSLLSFGQFVKRIWTDSKKGSTQFEGSSNPINYHWLKWEWSTVLQPMDHFWIIFSSCSFHREHNSNHFWVNVLSLLMHTLQWYLIILWVLQQLQPGQMVVENHLNRQKMPHIISTCLKKLVLIENVDQPHQELKKDMVSQKLNQS